MKTECEICNTRKAVCLSLSDEGEWRITCEDCEPDEYWIPIKSFNLSTLCHLHQRTEFNKDKFFEMIERIH